MTMQRSQICCVFALAASAAIVACEGARWRPPAARTVYNKEDRSIFTIATPRGAYISFDSGCRWYPLHDAAATDAAIQPRASPRPRARLVFAPARQSLRPVTRAGPDGAVDWRARLQIVLTNLQPWRRQLPDNRIPDPDLSNIAVMISSAGSFIKARSETRVPVVSGGPGCLPCRSSCPCARALLQLMLRGPCVEPPID